MLCLYQQLKFFKPITSKILIIKSILFSGPRIFNYRGKVIVHTRQPVPCWDITSEVFPYLNRSRMTMEQERLLASCWLSHWLPAVLWGTGRDHQKSSSFPPSLISSVFLPLYLFLPSFPSSNSSCLPHYFA